MYQKSYRHSPANWLTSVIRPNVDITQYKFSCETGFRLCLATFFLWPFRIPKYYENDNWSIAAVSKNLGYGVGRTARKEKWIDNNYIAFVRTDKSPDKKHDFWIYPCSKLYNFLTNSNLYQYSYTLAGFYKMFINVFSNLITACSFIHFNIF